MFGLPPSPGQIRYSVTGMNHWQRGRFIDLENCNPYCVSVPVVTRSYLKNRLCVCVYCGVTPAGENIRLCTATTRTVVADSDLIPIT
jgi:hypothetical protein